MTTNKGSLRERTARARRLLDFKQGVAEAVTEEFLRRHPDWLAKYGERARSFGVADACYHIDFLAAAIEAGETAPFEEYVRWAAGMLKARDIQPNFVAENLEQIGEALSLRLPDEDASAVREFIRAGGGACEGGVAGEEVGREAGQLALARGVFLQAILRGERSAAWTAVSEALREGHPLLDVYSGVLQEAMYETGRLWAANRITVAQEHMATAVTQYVIMRLYAQLERKQPRRGKVVITGVEGEMHQVGANMVADMLEADGWDVRFLGTNMPHSGILNVIEEYRPDILCISATMLFSLPKVISLINDCREQSAPGRLRIVLGGAAFRSSPALVAELGVDGFAPDIRSSLDMMKNF